MSCSILKRVLCAPGVPDHLSVWIMCSNLCLTNSWLVHLTSRRCFPKIPAEWASSVVQSGRRAPWALLGGWCRLRSWPSTRSSLTCQCFQSTASARHHRVRLWPAARQLRVPNRCCCKHQAQCFTVPQTLCQLLVFSVVVVGEQKQDSVVCQAAVLTSSFCAMCATRRRGSGGRRGGRVQEAVQQPE